MTDLTPAKARLLLLMHRYADFVLDEKVIEIAEHDRIDPRGIDPEDQEAIQFIFDTNFRAGISVATNDRARALRIIRAALDLAGVTDPVVVDRSLSNTNHIDEFDFETLMPLRKRVLIVNLDHLENNSSVEILGKMFPKILCVGSMLVQYSFAFGGQTSTTTRMGHLLYPAVEDSIKKSTWKRNEEQSLLAMGVYPGFIGEMEHVPKKIDNLIIPRRAKQY